VVSIVLSEMALFSPTLFLNPGRMEIYVEEAIEYIGVFQGVTMDFLKFDPGPPCPTLLRPEMARRAIGLQPSSSLLDTPRCMPIKVTLWTQK
jgi:hypothetical protein